MSTVEMVDGEEAGVVAQQEETERNSPGVTSRYKVARAIPCLAYGGCSGTGGGGRAWRMLRGGTVILGSRRHWHNARQYSESILFVTVQPWQRSACSAEQRLPIPRQQPR